jgi:pantothenate kinase
LYDQKPLRQISELIDDTWFVDVASDLVRQRNARRHLQSGTENTWEAAVRRREGNDLVNGEEIRSKLDEPKTTVQSVDEILPTVIKGEI